MKLISLFSLFRHTGLGPPKARTTSISAPNYINVTQSSPTIHHSNHQTTPVSPDTFFTALEVSETILLAMAPSEIQTTQDDLPETAKNSHSKPDQSSPIAVKSKTKNTMQEDPKSKTGDASKESKLSGAELKKKAKEEKAAKRAREKQNQQQQQLPTEPSNIANRIIPKGDISSTPTTSILKNQQKNVGLTGGAAQKSLPIRPVEIPSVPPVPEPKKENKNVALFGHLYGNPRRTTIAGAGKDVHPAVLALGLQMSNYVICGSNARCVATLLVFKRVG